MSKIWNACNKWGKAILIIVLSLASIGVLTAVRWILTWIGF